MARIELQFLDRSKAKGAIDAPMNAPGAWTLSDEWGIGLTQGQKPRTPEQAIESFTSWVYICATLNASSVAAVPLRLYARKTSKSQKFKSISTKPINRKQREWLSSNAGIESYLKKAVEVEEVTEHPFISLMEKPNKFITALIVKETTSLFTDLTGDAYWYLAKGRLNIPEQIWVIPSQYITPIYGETLEEFVTGYKFQRGRTELVLPLEDVIHFSYPNPKNQYQGLGCVVGVSDAVYVNAKMFEYEEAVFKNKARTGGVLESTEGISRPEMERLRLEWQQKYEGAAAGGRTVILPPGMKFTKDTMNPSELSFIQGKKATAEEIMAAFDIPPGSIKTEGVNRANAEVADYRHAKNGILPRCRRQEQVINQFLLPKYGNKEGQIFVAYDDPVPANREAVLKENTEYVAGGVLSIDEVREEEGKEPLPDGIGAIPYQDGRRIQVGTMPPQPGQPVEPNSEKLAEEIERKTLQKLRERLT